MVESFSIRRSDSKKKQGFAIQQPIGSFVQNLAALRGFVTLVKPFLEEASLQAWKANRVGLIPMFIAINEHAKPDEKRDDEFVAKLRSQFGSEIRVVTESANEDGEWAANIELDGNHELLDRAIKSVAQHDRQRELLHETALISLVSAAEWFLARIMHQHFESHPEAAGIRDKSLTFSDLHRLGTIEDARKHLIDSVIEDVLRGPFSGWVTFLKQRMNLELSYLNKDEDRLVEICQRRNLLVHNGGVVNSIYLSRVSSGSGEGLTAGDRLGVPHDYLLDSISCIEKFFLLVAFDLWKRTDESDEDRAELLIELAMEHLQAERWGIAEALSKFLMHDRRLPESYQLVGKINYWQSLKWQDRFQEIRSDVETADMSAKRIPFQLACAVLLDREEHVIMLTEKGLGAEEITVENLSEWPLFRQFRENQAFCARFLPGRFAASEPIATETSDEDESPDLVS